MPSPAAPSPDHALAARLDASRQELLDLGLRNPLLNFRPSASRGVRVARASATAVFDRLVREGKTMHFRGVADAPAVPTGTELPARPTGQALATDEPASRLERRLLNTYYTARTSLEEQGVNILFLALGLLTWYETDSSTEPRQAPLVLVPVVLERGTAAEPFRLRYSGAEVEGNGSLQARLRASFGVELPLPELDEDGSLAGYQAAVAAAVAGFPRWQVAPDDVVLGFFSFGKLRLYRDLDPASWPAQPGLLAHPALQALLGTDDGFADSPPTLDDTAFLDTDSPAASLHQVLDADSSQLLALLAVHEGRNLIIQGPPGTGKSQTIANLLAEAIGAGKTVLFVAEKMAALEVVKRRLDALGLGAACLELHSHKTNKKALLDELRHTLSLGRPAPAPTIADDLAQLPRYREALNNYALAVNAPLGRSRRTAQQVAGELLKLNDERGAVALPRLPFVHLADWTDADAAHAEALAARLQATLQKTGPPKNLIFWGSELTVLLPAAQAALAAQLQAAPAAVLAVQDTAAALARQLGLPNPTDRAGAEALLPAARHAQLAPALAGAAVADVAWVAQAGRINEILQAGAAYLTLRQQYSALLLPEAWDQSFLPERAALLAAGNKWWKFLRADYRRARQRLQSFWRALLPEDPAALLPVIETIHEARRQAQAIAEAAPLMERLFGPAWQELRSDWPQLRRVAEYALLTHQRIARRELLPELLTYLARTSPAPLSPGEELGVRLANLETALLQHRATLQAVADALHLNEARRFGPEGRLQFQPFAAQLATLATWAANLPALRLTVEWNNVAATVRAEQRPELLLPAESWPEAARYLALAVRQTWLEFLQQTAHEQHSALRQFERTSHEEGAARFRQADHAALYYNRIRAMQQHFEGLPNLQAGGQMRVLSREFAKKSRHLPLRRLMQNAGRAVQAIKPVMMMSPLSVATYLPPGAVEFDLVVFDEASQVKPVDALGAIARGRQLVVVGDSKQLPPTSFFDSLTGAAEEADEESATADIPSILELCRARQMPERLLRWHYRSRHESLIAPSNHLFYNDQLVVFPSPGGSAELGLRYHHLPDTYYERGTTRTNPEEAAAVAEAVLHHARTTPERTLGIVAFSMAQRQAIEDALEIQRKQHPDTDAFFSQHPHEPFFIKNLENVQGDERDVIFISLGYGRTREGYLAMSFGPLNGDGGERRLNVLITRAKLRCEVFTNLRADDLDLSRTPARGVAALKAFLAYAQTGRLPQTEESGRAPESPFEEAVYRALTARGYQLRPQVGSQGFYLDLAVIDPNQPGRYLLGIECDGAMYHAARSARDRDRLRQQVLAVAGWRLHRIWSTDWFRDPAGETDRAVAAIEAARHCPTPAAAADSGAAPATASSPTTALLPSPNGLARETPAAAGASAAPPYQLAQLPPVIRQKEIHQHPAGRLAAWVAEVVAVESPVHADEVTRRLALASGATQVGSRIRASVAAAIRVAGQMSSIRPEGDFLWTPTMRPAAAPVRDRSALPAASRKPGLIAPEELEAAVLTAVGAGFSIEKAAAPAAAARLLGFVRPGEELRQLLVAC
jgi:very-short-patch-repair endonuclease